MVAKVTLRTRRARLKKLIDYLQHIPKGREFDMAYYGRHQGEHPPEEKNYCGTAACALGHAAMIPSFRRAGLRLAWKKQIRCECAECKAGTGVLSPVYDATVRFGRKKHNDAGQAFFGLTRDEASLFGETWLSRDNVIVQLRAMLRAKP